MNNRKKILVTLAGVALAAGVTTSAVAAIPDSTDHTIHACLHKPTGMIRLIDKEADETCGAGFTEITWNQTGPAGPVGPKGDTGAKGDKGDDGATGPAGPKGDKGDIGAGYRLYQQLRDGDSLMRVFPGQSDDATVSCNEGDIAIAGGTWAAWGAIGGGRPDQNQTQVQNDLKLVSSYPPSYGQRSWTVVMFNSGTVTRYFQPHALCMDVTP